MNTELLARAIRILKRVPKRKFDLLTWASFTKTQRDLISYGKLKPILNGCGTAGCAMGWIASDARCMKEGLRLEMTADHAVMPVFGRSIGFEAAEAFFAVKDSTALNLFSRDSYGAKESRDPRFVIERLQLLIDAGSEATFRDMIRHLQYDYLDEDCT